MTRKGLSPSCSICINQVVRQKHHWTSLKRPKILHYFRNLKILVRDHLQVPELCGGIVYLNRFCQDYIKWMLTALLQKTTNVTMAAATHRENVTLAITSPDITKQVKSGTLFFIILKHLSGLNRALGHRQTLQRQTCGRNTDKVYFAKHKMNSQNIITVSLFR